MSNVNLRIFIGILISDNLNYFNLVLIYLENNITSENILNALNNHLIKFLLIYIKTFLF